ncbi:MAG TPA: RNA polymerase subunit sigma-70, partial [Dysgonomonas sp.]|nr:RNA polymerase subunit sigma-70 [Dysgonomonas sp.]
IIFKVISFYADSDHPSKDLYQEIILNLWKSYPSFRGESKVSTWMYRIALNTCLTFSKKKRNNVYYADILFDVVQPEDNAQDIQQLYKLIGRLGEIERALILLYLDEKPYKEISEITGLTVTNVATKIGRIKEKLRKMSDE